MLRLALVSGLKNALVSRKIASALLPVRPTLLQRQWLLVSSFHTSQPILMARSSLRKPRVQFSDNIVPNSELRYKILHFENGDHYEGSVYGEQMYGWGTYFYADGNLFEGVFREGRIFSGQGRMKYNDGRVFDGFWKDGLWEGQGKLTYPSEETLEGEFREGVIYNGKGLVYINFKKDMYFKGEFQEGLKTGFGVLKLDIFTYVGGWKADHRHGPGRITFPSGQVFEGQFVDHWIRQGEGGFVCNRTVPPAILIPTPAEMNLPRVCLHKGDVYEGEWKDYKPHGTGKIIGAKGNHLEVTCAKKRIF